MLQYIVGLIPLIMGIKVYIVLFLGKLLIKIIQVGQRKGICNLLVQLLVKELRQTFSLLLLLDC